MRPVDRLLICIGLAPLIWLIDSLLLAFTSGLGFGGSLWENVSTPRLLFRLVLTLAVLTPGFVSYLGYIWRRYEIVCMNKADDGTLFGDANSQDDVRRILYYCMRLAAIMKMPARERDKLRILCYSHDIGMFLLPVELQERQPRTRQEWRIYMQHAAYGAQIAASLPQLKRAASLIALHEERYDGSGPNALVGRSVPLACRIFTTVSMFVRSMDAQEPQMTVEEALDELNLYANTVLDPDVVNALRDLIFDKRLSRLAREQVLVSP